MAITTAMAEGTPHNTHAAEIAGYNSDANDSGTEWWDDEEKEPISPVNATARITQWPRPPGATAANPPKSTTRTSSRKSERRYSVQKPMRIKSQGRQKKQNAMAGIKVVTSFSNPRGAKSTLQPTRESRERAQAGCFVDLAALQALNGEPVEASGGFWKSRKAKESSPIASTERSTQTPTSGNGSKIATSAAAKPKGLVPSPLNLNDDLSPSDRPIVIGISIPSASLVKHAISPQTASSYTSNISQSYERRTPTGYTPETPTILITPAQDGPTWSPLGQHIGRASSVYSQPPQDAFGIYTSKDAPPVPQVPTSVLESENQRIAAQRSYFSPDSEQDTSWGDDDTKFGSPHKYRITSSCTVFEEDESPVLTRSGRPRSVSAATKDNKHTSVSTVATRQSKGWWNLIITPFLTRSNTVAMRGVFEDQQPPALPSLAVASAKASEADRDRKLWEKQFSPITPATATTINSDDWWEAATIGGESKDKKYEGVSPVAHTARHVAQPSSGTIPFVLSEVAPSRTIHDLASNPSTNYIQSQQNFSLPRVPPAAAISNGRGTAQQASGLPNPSTRVVSQDISPFVQPRLVDLNGSPAQSRPVMPPVMPSAREGQSAVQPSPPPPYSPAPRRYRAILPPHSHREPENPQHPASPGPVSPGLEAAMSSQGAIPMSSVPIALASRTPINLNSGYPDLPPRSFTPPVFLPPPTSARKAEAKRQRYEKEDAIARKAGGLWRGRGCISNRGCYGRGGAEGRKKRRLYFGLIAGFLSVIILIVVLASTLHKKSKTVVGPSQWLNLTGFPPIYTGLSTVAAPINGEANTGCVVPATQWSCSLPKEQQASVAPNAPNSPNFLLQIQWDNSSAANATFANVTGNPNLVIRNIIGNPVSAGYLIRHLLLKARQAVSFSPNPAPPSFAEESFLGGTTDGIVSADKAGEPTPFYISFLPTTSISLSKRKPVVHPRADNLSDPFPDVSTIIPAPSLNADGTAAPANLLPLPSQQPIRLYDRGLPTEHYGFYSYFDRSIFLKSITAANGTSSTGANPDDENGGSKESEASFRCTWAQTRFLVQMWTKANSITRLLNATSSSMLPPGQDFTQPGSFPYPITITIDRHGGDPTLKMLYCYSMNDQGGLVATSGHINVENRGFGGTLINPAPNLFSNSSDPSLGGFDGGTGGCGCQWTNFQNVAS